MSEIKQEREREFHNKTFAEGTRHSLGATYAIVRDSKRAFEKKVFAECESKSILEYGCGMGSYSFALAARGARVTGIDISDVAIAQATARAASEGLDARYVRMDAENLEFAEDTFDRVCGVAILHHLDLPKALSGLARVLKPAGQAVFMEPLGHNPAINLFRRMTPTLRTADEHPLLMHDLNLARRYFGSVQIEYYNLATLLAIPLRNTPVLNSALTFLNGVDKTMFWGCPPLRRWAWQVVITLSEPRKKNS